MKLSELTAEQFADVAGELAIAIGNICENPKAMSQIEIVLKSANKNLNEALMDTDYKAYYDGLLLGDKLAELLKQLDVVNSAGKLLMFVGALMTTNKEDVYTIVSILADKKVDELKQLNVMEFVTVAKGCLDADFFAFFKSLGATTQGE